VCSGRPRTRRFSLLATVRASHKTTAGHGGAAVLGMAASGGVGSKKGQRPGLSFKATAHACWGAHLRVPRPARVRTRGHARDADTTRAHRHGAAATKRWRRPTARGERPGGWRARRRRRRHLQKITTQPGSMAGITSSGAAAWWRGTFRLGSKAVASTGEKKRRPHLGGHWRGAGVGERVCGAVKRKPRKQGVAGVLGSRGSGSSSRAAPASRRVELLRAPQSSSFSSPSPSPPACG
jgi:hypothetical protein